MSFLKKFFGQEKIVENTEQSKCDTNVKAMREGYINIYFNGDFYYIEILISSMPNRNAMHQFLHPDVTNEDLGDAIINALGQYAELPENEQDAYEAGGVQYEKQKFEKMRTQYGYKNKTALLGRMIHLYVELIHGVTVFQPSFTTGLGNWPATTELDDAVVRLPDTATAEEVGKAARLALKGCRNTYGAKKGLPEHNFDAFLK